MAAAASEQSFESALAATVRSFAGQIQKLNLSTNVSTTGGKTLWLVEALSYCVQREFERQPFIPPLRLTVSMRVARPK